MTVYVDNARIPFGRMLMSHLQADTEDELHEFAARLGLRREWFQPGTRPEAAHYDVSVEKRELALRLGAVSETRREGSDRRRAVRERRMGLVA